jgi:hypothetical protein
MIETIDFTTNISPFRALNNKETPMVQLNRELISVSTYIT